MGNISISKLQHSFELELQSNEFKILQVTDMHFNHFDFKNKSYLKEIKMLVETFKPDLVINTGDLFCNVPMFYAKKILRDFDSIIGSIVPWAFAWGNHDCEMVRKGKFFKNLDYLEHYMEKLPNCLYVKSRKFIEKYGPEDFRQIKEEKEVYVDPMDDVAKWKTFDGFYGGNYKIQIKNRKAVPLLNLFMMNSRRKHSIPPNALNWMGNEIEADNKGDVPSLLFFHVPVFQYHTIWEENIALGVKGERICFELDKGRVHNFLKKYPQIKACFVGHDHVNDYSGKIDGIEYVYGRKTGPLGYGGHRSEQQYKFGSKKIKYGAKLITHKFNQETGELELFEHLSVFDDGTTWKPKKMEYMLQF